ncbi:MAG: glycosyltransferase family 4 protein [Acidobacteria bacterium]|nr:glycosyltransferase family 4 protein [Acidobacteriota bacterium]
MGNHLRIALVAPVAQPVPPPRSGSIETFTALLAAALTARGHDVTVFATAGSTVRARVYATFERGYLEDASLWPWEMCELLNISAAIRRAADFDVIHAQAEFAPLSLPFAGLCPTPLLHTVHHLPTPSEAALWARHEDATFVAVSAVQARAMAGLRIAGVIHHALDLTRYRFSPTPGDALLFLGRFTPGKGVREAIDIARRSGHKLVLAAAENDYYRAEVAPLVDGVQVTYAGELDHDGVVAHLGRARALLYPLQAGESFGLVLAEAAACGTPVAALRLGAVEELVAEGVSGRTFASVDDLIAGLPSVLALDRAAVRAHAEHHFGVDRMADAYAALYASVAASRLAL